MHLPHQLQGLAIGPLTPPAHELEHPHPIYGQPHVQGVVVKAGPCSGTHLTNLTHPGTPPDTPPVSTSPPVHLHRVQDHRIQPDTSPRVMLHVQSQQQLSQPPHHQDASCLQGPDAGMNWVPHPLRQEPLDLRPHCPPGQTPEPPPPEHWPGHHHHHLPDLVQHHSRTPRHTGQ